MAETGQKANRPKRAVSFNLNDSNKPNTIHNISGRPNSHPATSSSTKGVVSRSTKLRQPHRVGSLRSKAADIKPVISFSNKDITTIDVDVIICPVSKKLQTDRGIANVVSKKAGVRLRNRYKEELKKSLGILDVGTAFLSPSYNLHSCRQIIHVVVPKMEDYNDAEYLHDLQKAFDNAFKQLKRLKIVQSVAVPALGAGTNGIPKIKVAETLSRALNNFLRERNTSYKLDKIILVSIDSAMLQLLEEHCGHKGIVFPSASNASDDVAHVRFFSSINNNNDDDDDKVSQTKERNVVTYDSTESEEEDGAWGGLSRRSKEGKISCKLAEEDETSDSSTEHGTDITCPICFDSIKDEEKKRIPACEHQVCRDCWKELERHDPVCPVCRRAYGVINGNQPEDAVMHIRRDRNLHLPGFKQFGTIIIDYHVPNGVQTEIHPHPGKKYKETTRTAYLPDNEDGRKVLALLEKAFEAKLIFTVGRSVTSGMEDVVTWNDIHHKTTVSGQGYGYPDPTYLDRVKEELEAKGIK